MKLSNWEFINAKRKIDQTCVGYWMRKEKDTNIEVVRVISSLGMFVVYITEDSIIKNDNLGFKIEIFKTIEEARLWCDIKLNDLGYNFQFSGGV